MKRAIVFIRKKWMLLLAGLVFLGALILLIVILTPPEKPREFNADRAYRDVVTQVDMGPRVPGSDAHARFRSWLVKDLKRSGWRVETQSEIELGHNLYNIIAKRGSGRPWIILAAHYDSRYLADHDSQPDRQLQPVPGANDGASGVAVLLELARILPGISPGRWGWSSSMAKIKGILRVGIGSWIKRFRRDLRRYPDKMVLIDMIGDRNLQVFYERNSDIDLSEDIWQPRTNGVWRSVHSTAQISDPRRPYPLPNAGIPAVDIIDFDYSYWHTSQDTQTKLRPKAWKLLAGHCYPGSWMKYSSLLPEHIVHLKRFYTQPEGWDSTYPLEETLFMPTSIVPAGFPPADRIASFKPYFFAALAKTC